VYYLKKWTFLHSVNVNKGLISWGFYPVGGLSDLGEHSGGGGTAEISG